MHRVVRLLALALWTLSMATGRALGQHGDHNWVVGLAYGPGRSQIETGEGSLKTDWVEGPAQAIRFGRMLHARLQLGFEHQAWLNEQGLVDLKIRVGTQLESLALTFYPGRPGSPTGGIFVTVGTGYAHARLTFLEPLEPGESLAGDTYEIVAKKDEFGWGAVGALGYEFAIARGITAGFMISYNYLDIGESIYDTVQFIPLLANLNWYF